MGEANLTCRRAMSPPTCHQPGLLQHLWHSLALNPKPKIVALCGAQQALADELAEEPNCQRLHPTRQHKVKLTLPAGTS